MHPGSPPISLQKQPLLTCALGRPRAHIIGEDRATADVIALHVDHQEMVPFPTWRNRGPSALQDVITHSWAQPANVQHTHAPHQDAVTDKTDGPAFSARANLTRQQRGPSHSLPPSDSLGQGSAHFFCEGPDRKCFRLCTTHCLYHNYSTLQL